MISVKMAKAFRRAKREAAKEHDRKVMDLAGLRVQRRSAVYAAAAARKTETPRGGRPPRTAAGARLLRLQEAVCQDPSLLRFHVRRPAASSNYAKREQTADLSGHYALVTGARVKIGFQASLKLLRAGAHVIVTTQIPHRRGGPVLPGGGFPRLPRQTAHPRPRSAAHAERRIVRAVSSSSDCRASIIC